MPNLKNSWTIWYHSSNINKWDKDTYVHIGDYSDIIKFFSVFNHITIEHYNNGIFFFMRTGTFPDWSDAKFKKGGFVSIKIEHKTIDTIKNWLEHLISEDITCDSDVIIYGLSVSPKNKHYILKLWCNQKLQISKLSSHLPSTETCKFTSFSYKK